MHYDPVKNNLRVLIRRSPLLRRLFYRLLGLLFLREWYVKRTVRRLELKPDKELALLDAGSGFGQYAWFCARRFPHAAVTGIELEEHHVEDCRAFAKRSRLNNLHYTQGDLLKLSERETYDLALCIDVFEHIEDDMMLMGNLCNALKTHGTLIITSPSLERPHHEDNDFVGEHVREGYDTEEIRQKLLITGFKHVDVGWMYGPFGDFAWRLSIRNTMRLTGRGMAGKAAAIPYLIVVLPVALAAMCLDFTLPKKWGTGLIIRAHKRSLNS